MSKDIESIKDALREQYRELRYSKNKERAAASALDLAEWLSELGLELGKLSQSFGELSEELKSQIEPKALF